MPCIRISTERTPRLTLTMWHFLPKIHVEEDLTACFPPEKVQRLCSNSTTRCEHRGRQRQPAMVYFHSHYNLLMTLTFITRLDESVGTPSMLQLRLSSVAFGRTANDIWSPKSIT
jgi:hypothetical protein